MEKEMKLAVLIDAENIAGKYIEVILSEANSLGNILYKRIYGNWTSPQMAAWREVILDNSIQPIQQYCNTTGKNSSDSSLIIDAMDLLYQGRVDGFCIVSSDSDFTRLAARLRESEMFVMGMGEQKTPRSFISACNKFLYLDLLYAAGKDDAKKAEAAEKKAEEKADKPKAKQPAHKAAAPAASAVPAEPPAAPVGERAGSNIKTVRLALKELVEENADDEGWISSGKLGGLLSKRFPDFDVRNFGGKTFVPFVKSLGIFENKTIAPKEKGGSRLIYFRVSPKN